MEYGRDYFTRHFTTEWTDTKNVVVSLYEAGDPLHLQIGIIEVRLFRGESKYKGEAYIWNLWVSEDYAARVMAVRCSATRSTWQCSTTARP